MINSFEDSGISLDRIEVAYGVAELDPRTFFKRGILYRRELARSEVVEFLKNILHLRGRAWFVE